MAIAKKINLVRWQSFVEKYWCPEQAFPPINKFVYVVNIYEDDQDCFFEAPYTCALAKAKWSDEEDKFMWLNEENELLNQYDFRDGWSNNVFGHSAKVSHWIDKDTFNWMILRIFLEGEKIEDPIVLFSPAGASHDQYKDYKERGKCLKSNVKELMDKHGDKKC